MSLADGQGPIESAVSAALKGRNTVENSKLDERHLRRLGRLRDQNWKEIAFQFKNAVGSMRPPRRELLQENQHEGNNLLWDYLFVDVPKDDVEKIGAELYNVLSSLATDEAMVVLRRVQNRTGWQAWSR